MPLIAPAVDPEPDRICTLAPVILIVGLPPTPAVTTLT